VANRSQNDLHQADVSDKNLHPDDSQFNQTSPRRCRARFTAETSGLLLIAFLLLALAAIRYGQAIHWSVR
jgi:hypothetical protein